MVRLNVRSLLASAFPLGDRSASDVDESIAWHGMWAAVAASLLQDLESGHLDKFETGFRVVSDALNVSSAAGRQAAMPLLFGDFTRRAIGASFDRTRFVEWFGPAEILEAPSGRMRGRVLYFSKDKGRGKVLGADRAVYFVHFSAVRVGGYRSLDAGQLVEFRPQRGSFNGVVGVGAYDVTLVAEGPATHAKDQQ